MCAVSILRRRHDLALESEPPVEPVDWVNLAAGAALVAGGLLLLGRQRRTGLVVAATGTALALLEHQEAVRTWWHQVPGVVDQVQHLIQQVQGKVSDLSARREAIVEAVAEAAESPDMQRKED